MEDDGSKTVTLDNMKEKMTALTDYKKCAMTYHVAEKTNADLEAAAAGSA